MKSLRTWGWTSISIICSQFVFPFFSKLSSRLWSPSLISRTFHVNKQKSSFQSRRRQMKTTKESGMRSLLTYLSLSDIRDILFTVAASRGHFLSKRKCNETLIWSDASVSSCKGSTSSFIESWSWEPWVSKAHLSGHENSEQKDHAALFKLLESNPLPQFVATSRVWIVCGFANILSKDQRIATGRVSWFATNSCELQETFWWSYRDSFLTSTTQAMACADTTSREWHSLQKLKGMQNKKSLSKMCLRQLKSYAESGK